MIHFLQICLASVGMWEVHTVEGLWVGSGGQVLFSLWELALSWKTPNPDTCFLGLSYYL